MMEFASFDEVRAELDATCAWLAESGIRIQNNRIKSYQKILDTVINIWREQPKTIPESLEIEFINGLYEIGEITQLYRAFNKEAPEGFFERARVINKGNFSFSEDKENTNTTGRNITFELLVAARLSFANHQISLTITDDVSYLSKFGWASVQCKRCKSSAQVRANCDEAANQVKTDVDNTNSPVEFGIAALDLTKVINPDNKLYRGGTKSAVERQISYDLNLTIKNLLDTGEKLPEYCIGILIRLSCIAQITGTGDPFYAQYYCFWPRNDDSSEDRASELITALHKGHVIST